MGYLYLFVTLTIQATLIFAEEAPPAPATELDTKPDEVVASREVLQKPEDAIELVKGPHMDWIHLFSAPTASFPTPAALLMSKITESDRSPEEQCEAIKHMATQISTMMNAELIEVMNMFMENCDKHTTEATEETKKSKRSVESPLDSSQRLMRLLRHIKVNNENQNMAIEKLMTAQEIADKFGIEFTPEPEVLFQLENQTNEHAEELNQLMNETSANSNDTQEQVSFVALESDQQTLDANAAENSTYFVYTVPEEDIEAQLNSFPPHEYMPEILPQKTNEHHNHHGHQHHHGYHPHKNHFPENHFPQNNHFYPCETQMPPPPVQQPFYSPPVTPKPSYYDIFTPAPEFFTPIMFEPVTTTTTIILPIEETMEPELVGEEYEETVSSKVTVDHSEPGESVVNHVMTYTVAEKTHFKKPEIELLPQQMQYSFFLM